MKTGKTLQRFSERNRGFPEGEQNLKAEGEECTILNHENARENEGTLTVSKSSINFDLLLTQVISGRKLEKALRG